MAWLASAIMVALFTLPFVLAFGPAAVWALRSGGPRRLWLLCGLTFAAVVLVALLLSAVYSVPSTWRVVYYLLAFLGPSLLSAAGFLTLAGGRARTLPTQLVVAFAGSLVGLVGGLIAVVYV